jgi:1-aminocyclopropane-1-carboxylate deaminase
VPHLFRRAPARVVGIATSTDERRENYPPSDWLAREGFPWPVLADSADLDAAAAYGVTGFPTFLLFDADGTVLWRTSGELPIDYPRVPLLFGPSPIHPLPRLSAALGGKVEIWAKREDCNSGIAFGGNKVRKLEYLAADAIAQGCDTLVSIGGIQSNHTRQVTGVACALGLKAVTVQEGWVDWPDTVYDKVGNIQLTRIMGGDIRVDPAGFDIGFRDSWKRAIDSVIEAGGTPYPIPAGASDHPLGGMGFANWAREVAMQEAERDVFFDHVVVCTVTGSTHAGMIAGFALENRTDRRVLGIDASKTLDQTIDQVTRIAANTAAKIGVDRDLRPDEITVLPGYEGPAYGVPDEQTVEAIHLAARTEGMLTDPVYEGKSMAGLIGLIRNGEIPAGSKVLYAHLGGQTALPAYAGDAPETFTRSLRETGFAVLVNHPLPWSLVEQIYREWAALFDSPAVDQYLMDAAGQVGYFPPDKSETAKGSAVRDLKEFFHVYDWSVYPAEVSDAALQYRQIAMSLANTLLGVGARPTRPTRSPTDCRSRCRR